MRLETQDPKYAVEVFYGPHADNVDGGMHQQARLCNRVTGAMIPLDEPVFLLRAQDALAHATLRHYVAERMVKCGPDDGLAERLAAFEQFATEHPDRVKLPS